MPKKSWPKGAQNVIISMAGDGALLVSQAVLTSQNQSKGK